MHNKKKKQHNFLKAGGLSVILFSLLCIGILVSTISFQDVITNPLEPRKWFNNALADHDPTGDMGGYIYFMTVALDTTPADSLNSNITMGTTAYEESDVINSEMGNETPHSTAYMYVINFKVNDTTSYNSSGTVWMPSWIYMNITVDHEFASDVAWVQMDLIEIANNTNFAWYHGYINNSGSGYTITNNEKFNATVNCTLWW